LRVLRVAELNLREYFLDVFFLLLIRIFLSSVSITLSALFRFQEVRQLI
jgi:hypothetical protein